MFFKPFCVSIHASALALASDSFLPLNIFVTPNRMRAIQCSVTIVADYSAGRGAKAAGIEPE